MNEPKFCGYCGRALKERESAIGSGQIFLTCPKAWTFLEMLAGDGRHHTNFLTDRKVSPKTYEFYDQQTGAKLR